MSPRFRWTVGRVRSDGPTGSPPHLPADAPADPADVADRATPGAGARAGARAGGGAGEGLSAVGRRLLGELETLAASGRTGALHVIGQPGGMIHFDRGRVVQVTAWTTPGADAVLLHRALGQDGWRRLLEGMDTSQGRDAALAAARDLLGRGALPPLHVELAARRAAGDAACALLTGTGTAVVRTRFLRDERPWLSLGSSLPVADVVRQAERHAVELARVADRAAPDGPVVRSAALPAPSVRLVPAQWDLLTCPDGPTPRALAWILGRGVAATTVEVARLARLGLVEAVAAVA